MTSQTTLIQPPTTREIIAAAAKGKGKPKKEQKPIDIGLFGSDALQLDMIDAIGDAK